MDLWWFVVGEKLTLLSIVQHPPQPLNDKTIRILKLSFTKHYKVTTLHTLYCSSSASFNRFLIVRSWDRASSYNKMSVAWLKCVQNEKGNSISSKAYFRNNCCIFFNWNILQSFPQGRQTVLFLHQVYWEPRIKTLEASISNYFNNIAENKLKLPDHLDASATNHFQQPFLLAKSNNSQ